VFEDVAQLGETGAADRRVIGDRVGALTPAPGT
jgi:hypothetical protein